MKTYDLAYMQESLREIAEENPMTIAECRYYTIDQSNGNVVPECIMGHWFEREGLRDFLLEPVNVDHYWDDGTRVDFRIVDVFSSNAITVMQTIAAASNGQIAFTTQAMDFATDVQSNQDTGLCWINALEIAMQEGAL